MQNISTEAIRSKSRIYISLLMGAFLSACGNPSLSTKSEVQIPTAELGIPYLDPSPFGAKSLIPNEAEIFKLTKSQEDEFLEYYNHEKAKGIKPHDRIYDYLENILEEFKYVEKTKVSKDTLTTKKGNCLSLAALTTSLANLVNIKIDYQKVNSPVEFYKKNNLIIRSTHLRSFLYDPDFKKEKGVFYIQPPRIRIDYFPESVQWSGELVYRPEFISMFYQNLAAEYIYEGNYTKSYWLLREGMNYDESNPEIINMLAVLYRRVGDNSKAEELYKYGLSLSNKKITLLKNYRLLLLALNRNNEAEVITKRLVELDDPSPFEWISLGYRAINDNNYTEAEIFFKKAIQYAPYLYQGHIGLARSYAKNGKLTAAIHTLRQAIINSQSNTNTKNYKLELEELLSRET